MLAKAFPDTRHAINSRFLKKKMLEIRLIWFALGWNDKCFCRKTVNQNWLGQFGSINIPVALSEIIFCNTFPMHENGGKQ